MHDLIASLEQASRAVADTELRDVPAHVVELRRALHAPVGDVWDACTNPERVRRWFLPLSGELRPGGSFQLEGNAGGTITICEPPHRLELTWQFGDTEPSLVSLELVSAGEDTTELVLRHTVPDDDHWAQFGPGAVGVGWEGALTGLTALIAGEGRSSNGAQAMAAFMRRSAVLWSEAHEAAGATPVVASEAAIRTSAFYAPAEPSSPR
ncbi:MAG: SRPBCC family protein [Solirubrobacteraceae bacterium]